MQTTRFWLPLFFLLLLPLHAQGGTGITRISDKQEVTMRELSAKAAAADLVLVGEVHDSKAVHELQLTLVRALAEKKLPLAIGLEVIQSDSQQYLDQWVEGKLTEEEFKPIFGKNWSYDWRLYRDLFIFARDNRIPMVGLNVPKEIVMKVSRKGYGSLSEEEKKKLPPGTNADLNTPHTVFLKESFEALFSSVTNGRVFEYFCQAQTVRNSGMAMQIANYTRKNPKVKMVVFAGIWHSVKNAIPDQLQRNGSKVSSLVIMPYIPEFSGDRAAVDVIDYLVELPSGQ